MNGVLRGTPEGNDNVGAFDLGDPISLLADRLDRHRSTIARLHGRGCSDSCGSLEKSTAPDDAFVVERMREAGAIILAKANLHELAGGGTTVSSLGGQTRNPYALNRTSGGTGAALATNMAPIGFGTDTVNSVRSPASACNLVGLRPSHGLVSRDGTIPVAFTQDMVGPITQSVADAVRMLDVIAGYDPQDPSTAKGVEYIPDSYTDGLNSNGLHGARIGIFRSVFSNGPESRTSC